MHGQQNIKFVVNSFNLLKPTGYVMHHQFNIQQLYALPTLCLCIFYSSHNKQWLLPHIAYTDWFYNRVKKCLLRGTDWVFKWRSLCFVFNPYPTNVENRVSS